MKIVIETIAHDKQRYETCGDWWIDNEGTWQIRISELPLLNVSRMGMYLCVAIHELVEMALCQAANINEEEVTEFDERCIADDVQGEPGDQLDAPYYKQHQIATGIERIIAAELGVNWGLYENAIDNL